MKESGRRMARASLGLPCSSWPCSWYSSSFWYFRLRFCAATLPPEGPHGESALRGRFGFTKRGAGGSTGLKTRHYNRGHARGTDAGPGGVQAAATGGQEGEEKIPTASLAHVVLLSASTQSLRRGPRLRRYFEYVTDVKPPLVTVLSGNTVPAGMIWAKQPAPPPPFPPPPFDQK